MSNYRIETKCVHSGYEPKNGEPSMLPIVQSTTYKYKSSDEMGMLFDLEKDGYFYSRIANPTCDAVANRICDLEGGVGAILTGSGMAANFYAMFNIVEAGDHIVSASSIYGGSFNLYGHTMQKMGIECTFVDQDAPYEELCKAFKPNTKAVFAESLANPALTVLDIEKFAKLAHEHGCPLIMDNTFATPVNCNPFKWGCDIVTHSTSKYMDGHAMALGGCIVDSGNFDWEKYKDRYPSLTTPDESYHGIIYTKKFGKNAYINKIQAQLTRDLGAIQSPMNAFLTNVGLQSLPCRMERHCSNALKIAEFLKNSDKVAWVQYPGLKGDKYYDLAQKYMPNGTSGVIVFGLKGGRSASIKMMDSLKLASIETHVAEARTCVLHPASHTHRQMTDQELIEAGVKPDLIRLSVGLENADDLIEDLKQAMDQA